ncbi:MULTISPECIES: class I SAM-dependent methyltransferase [Thermoanaerobacter]|nr:MULTISPECIES: class I SAM-dependent methyltransferase [Thermoanaerobacter]
MEYYRKVLAILKEHVDLGKYIKFLDVGCGTGALCYVLNFNIIPHKNYDIIDTMV